MIIRTTTDPMTLPGVNPVVGQQLCAYEGDGENGVEIYFQSEQTREIIWICTRTTRSFFGGKR
jgi:hypothetical protein